ncbi:MAG: preprotein translocase subunit YajC [bacterium]|uniref:Sec translocon accessory complex subunit YajC n=1 Tax=Candidatus Aphodosoma intestinipullorum TaxID=2840674 RepID=A0A940DKS9_9BACT|nr:preprotein translocase subunit YajC [Candidatus Aphodosoma intestinipullorum]
MLNIILDAAAAGTSGAGGGIMQILMLVLIVVVFYFFMIRPQSKRQKEIKKFQDSLENGKHIITSGGIYGKVREVKDNYVVVEITDGVKIRVNKNMVFDSPEDANQTPAAPAK